MNIIDSFFFLFQTNAKEAQKDVEGFGKATQATQDQINSADKSAANLGLSFSKLALAGVAALESFASLGKLKDGLVNAINYNAQIERTAKLTGINARELSIWNGVVARAGGNPGSQEYLSFITKLNQQYAGLGVNQRLQYVNRDLGQIADKIKQLNDNSPGSGYAFAQKLGLGDDLYLALKNGSGALDELIAKQKQLDTTSEATAEASFELKQGWADVTTEFMTSFTQLIPLAKGFLYFIEGIGKALRVVADLLTFNRQDLVGFLHQGDDDLTKKYKAYHSSTKTSGVGASNQDESRAFWKAQGYSNEQVAALLANEKAEGGFASNAVGDNGQAKGLFQWHAPRRARILAATGIDVATASHGDQLKAAAWELEQTGTADRLRNAQTPGQGASILTSYEAPANPGYQAFLRGQSADSYFAQMGRSAISGADSTNIPSSGNNSKTITIGSITINTQATDANGMAGDMRDALNKELAETAQSFDNGRMF